MNGQERTRRLGELEQQYLWDPLQRYLGPTGIPDRLRGALGIASMLDPVQGITGSMAAADRGDYGEAAIGTIAAAAPLGIAALGRRFAVPATRAATAGAYDDAARALEETLSGTTAFSQALPAPAATPADELAGQVQQLEDPPGTIEVDIPGILQPAAPAPSTFDYYSGPLRHSPEAGIAGLYSGASRAAKQLKQPTYSSPAQLRAELEARGARGKELDWKMQAVEDLFIGPRQKRIRELQNDLDVNDMFGWPEGWLPGRADVEAELRSLQQANTPDARPRVSAADIQRALNEAGDLSVYRTKKFSEWAVPAGENHVSTVFAHPLVPDGPPQSMKHFSSDDAGGDVPLLHTRSANYRITTPDGSTAKTHHVVEIQSDWAQYRQTLPTERVEPLTQEERAELVLLEDNYDPELDEASQQRLFELKRRHEQGGNPTRAEFDRQFPAPLVKDESDWLDAGVRQNLLDAVNSDSEWITFGNGVQANRPPAEGGVGMPLEAAKRFYDQQVPRSVERVLKKFAKEAGVDAPRLEKLPFVDNTDVLGFRITPEFREAMRKTGLPSFKDGGLVSTPEGMRRGSVLPAMWPEGMTGAEALMSGQMDPAFPGFITEPINVISESLMTLDRIRRGEDVPQDEVTAAALALGTATAAPALRGGPASRSALSAGGAGPRGPKKPPAPDPATGVSVNLRTDPYDVRIDRKTKWGNPFVMRGEADRARVISDYRGWLWGQIRSGEIDLEELASLSGKRLGCHCAPKPCHGDVLCAAADWAKKTLAEQKKEPSAEPAAPVSATPAGQPPGGKWNKPKRIVGAFKPKEPGSGKVKTVAPAPEGFVPKGPREVATNIYDPVGDPAGFKGPRGPKVTPTPDTEARVAAAEEKMAVPTSFKLVSAPDVTTQTVRQQGTATYSPRAGEVLPGPRAPVRSSTAQNVSTTPGPQYLEVPMSALEQIGLDLRHLTDPKTRVSPDGSMVYLHSGQDTARFLRVWKDQARWFGLPEQPKLTLQRGQHRPLLETRSLENLRASDVPKKPLGGR